MARALSFALIALALAAAPASAEEPAWRHALSLLDTVKYPAGFRHFDYVNPAAPKGGQLRLSAFGTFDSFNVVIESVKGQTPGALATRVYQTLMTGSLDEVATGYGLIAEAVRHPADLSSVTYRLRAEARWHDGAPITVDDVIWSMETFKRLSPQHAFYYRNVVAMEKTGEREVTFRFDKNGVRELPFIVGELMVLPKHWWEGRDAAGKPRNIAETTLEPPLGSGSYRIKSFEAGRYTVFERVADAWARDLPVQAGKDNFDLIRTDHFLDDTVQFEAFKADKIDFRTEGVARQWARSYDFTARRDGRVILESFREEAVGWMQAFVLNLRRKRFQDVRVRRAFELAFDFEEANRTLFHGLYHRIDSYFFGLEVASSGLPSPAELAVLAPYRGKIPDSVFTEPFANPRFGAPEALRTNLREALRLLGEAGWEIRGGRLVEKASGEPFEVEFIVESDAFERIILFYKANLARLGVEVKVRKLDTAQYENRRRKRDFDIVMEGWGQVATPGSEQREYWGSAAAARDGSKNVAGIENPVVDDLIERLILARDREEQITISRALDRVLLHSRYMVMNWAVFSQWTARWDRFGRPATMPRYGAAAFPTIWWYDPDRAAKTGAPR